MIFLAAVILSLALIGAFLLLSRYETARGARFFGSARSSLDERVERMASATAHIDLPAFLWHAVKDASARLMHDAVALIIFLLRQVERLLLRLARSLRSRRSGLATLTSRGSAFVENIAHFKRSLRSKNAGEGETTPPPQV